MAVFLWLGFYFTRLKTVQYERILRFENCFLGAKRKQGKKKLGTKTSHKNI